MTILLLNKTEFGVWNKYKGVLVTLDRYDKFHRWSGLNNKFVPQSSESWESKIKVLAGLVSGKGPLFGWQMASFLCPHIGGQRRRRQALWCIFL